MTAIDWTQPGLQPEAVANIQHCLMGDSPEVMTAIYTETVNLVVLKRSLQSVVIGYCQALADHYPHFNVRTVISAERVASSLNSLLPELEGQPVFIEDLERVLEMYACLFDLDEIGFRMQLLDRAMCPRFHTDKLGCRLVTTYLGQGTEWLDNSAIDRSKLGRGSQGLKDDESGLYSASGQIEQAEAGDILLLKGEGWYGNEGLGVVHRSPVVEAGQRRLVVTLDFA